MPTMATLKPGFTLAAILVACLAHDAGAQWEGFCSTATTAAPAGSFPVLYNLPNGQGSPFTQARVHSGIVDATITLTLLDDGCMPIANFAAADMWLEKSVAAGTGNFTSCLGGTIADANTDALGMTRWANPLRAGGWSTSKTLVVVAGSPLVSNSGLVLRHNSADINGDRVVDLADIPLFAADFGSTALRSDLKFDGVVNISDIPMLAAGVGADCP
jgi:hypothetical protein